MVVFVFSLCDFFPQLTKIEIHNVFWISNHLKGLIDFWTLIYIYVFILCKDGFFVLVKKFIIIVFLVHLLNCFKHKETVIETLRVVNLAFNPSLTRTYRNWLHCMLISKASGLYIPEINRGWLVLFSNVNDYFIEYNIDLLNGIIISAF